MKVECFEKTPSLSLRLRVGRVAQGLKRASNNLECHSSSFEIIRVAEGQVKAQVSNKLEWTRICSNKLERRKDATHG